jgi:hypothetical protein
VLAACLLELGIPPVSAAQRPGAVPDRPPLRILVLAASGGHQPGDAGSSGLRDSAADLRTRLSQRLTPGSAVLVAEEAAADLTVVVIRREIVHDINVVWAELRIKDFRTEITGTDDGMWGPAATSLARHIAAWVVVNVEVLRDVVTDQAAAHERLSPPNDVLARRSGVEISKSMLLLSELEPGAGITIDQSGSRSHVYLVSAGDAVTVLNFNDVKLPRTARSSLLRIASSRPTFFPPRAGSEFRDGSVIVRSDGVFDGDRKLADLSEVLKTVPPSDVVMHYVDLTGALLITAVSVIVGLFVMSRSPRT